MEQPAQKKKTPIYKKWWFWVIVAIVVIGAIIPKNGNETSAPKETPGDPSAPTSNSTSPSASTPVPAPTPEPFEPILLTGNGDDVVEADLPSSVYVAKFTYDGSGNFIVKTHANDEEDLKINEIGKYSGSHVLWGNHHTFEITASGAWSIEIDAIKLISSLNLSGTGDSCPGMYIASASDSGAYEITHHGDDNFIIWMYTDGQIDLVLNEIGDYSGKKLIKLTDGEIVIFQINAGGDWEIHRAN